MKHSIVFQDKLSQDNLNSKTVELLIKEVLDHTQRVQNFLDCTHSVCKFSVDRTQPQ